MYNDIERCDNHIDYFATTGNFHEIFDDILYGYFYNRNQGDARENLKFTLYFVDPFDPVLDKCAGWSIKQEIDGFKSTKETARPKEMTDMQIVPLQYNDFYAVKSEYDHTPDRTIPSYDEALLNNIHYDKRTFFQRLLHKNPHQIKVLKENSILYKVTFDLPFDVIADYVTVDKTMRIGNIEKTKNIYSLTDGLNLVETLFKKMQRAESNLNEMAKILSTLRSNPEKFKRDNETFDWAEECRTKGGLNIEHAEFLFNKAKNAFEKMHKVLFQARYFDIKAEPEEVEDTKCSHELCTNKRETGSRFCNQCIQLPTKECNFCNKTNSKR